MNEWRTIDSAPTDGTRIDVKGGRFSTDDQSHGMKMDDDDYRSVVYVIQPNPKSDPPWYHSSGMCISNPTHWRFRPATT